MNPLKEAFIQLSLQCNVLKFGTFTLKSGRISPYFFNAGLFYQGPALKKLGELYAQTLLDSSLEFTQLFGPAYKGFTLATATAIALADMGRAVNVSFNRKEIKDHGEGGQRIGAPLLDKVVIIDDVITAGTAFREARHFIESEGGSVSGVLIALDRCEKGLTEQSTLSEIQQAGIATCSIIDLFDLIEYLKKQGLNEEYAALQDYQKRYGARI